MIMLAGLFNIAIPENLQVIIIEVTKALNLEFWDTEEAY